jgi:hypothetical protein
MRETSAYIEFERNAWSIVRQCEMRFRLTYHREFLPVQAPLAGILRSISKK